MAKQHSFLAALLGQHANKTGHLEKALSTIGGFCAILAVVAVSRLFLDLGDAAWVVGSMGASAVLLFAVPHGPLSQPWPLLGGHLVSAFIGVTCAWLIPDLLLAAACAVGLAIGAMQYLRSIHPPGGATALTAVIGGESVQALGYQFLLTPVLLNVLVMLLIAVLFNYPFAWRRYPTALASRMRSSASMPIHKTETRGEVLTHHDLEAALTALNRVVDISEDDLEEIYHLARQIARGDSLKPEDIGLGRYYSNGRLGPDWQIRHVIDMADPANPGRDLVIYKVVAGKDERSTGTGSRADFALWSHHEVFLQDNSWQRVENGSYAPEAG
jgi:CBS-domain-containing membrane protein